MSSLIDVDRYLLNEQTLVVLLAVVTPLQAGIKAKGDCTCVARDTLDEEQMRRKKYSLADLTIRWRIWLLDLSGVSRK